MKQFLYILLFVTLSAGCSDNQVAVEEDSSTSANSEKPAVDRRTNMKDQGVDDVDVDTIGMAEFLALKGAVAEKYKKSKELSDEDDMKDDTAGFTEYKRSKSKITRKPCDCEDSLKAADKSKSQNAKSASGEKSTKKSAAADKDTEDEADSIPVSRKVQIQ